ncbi:hypothetical protein BFAG_04345 [Bacteroides fragilis 3_1_12]|uniref:Uncharacterized protein n=1 Tax=Bacteroides fragilis 3_1_12 TaxID=457424 RepID=A0ABN0BRR8_BACFG|nr:hypothetical protein BFAG_04345 [Bacteroides fragilis 3_1_12]
MPFSLHGRGAGEGFSSSLFIGIYPSFIDFSLSVGGNTFLKVSLSLIFASLFSVNTCFDFRLESYNIYQICMHN